MLCVLLCYENLRSGQLLKCFLFQSVQLFLSGKAFLNVLLWDLKVYLLEATLKYAWTLLNSPVARDINGVRLAPQMYKKQRVWRVHVVVLNVFGIRCAEFQIDQLFLFNAFILLLYLAQLLFIGFAKLLLLSQVKRTQYVIYIHSKTKRKQTTWIWYHKMLNSY